MLDLCCRLQDRVHDLLWLLVTDEPVGLLTICPRYSARRGVICRVHGDTGPLNLLLDLHRVLLLLLWHQLRWNEQLLEHETFVKFIQVLLQIWNTLVAVRYLLIQLKRLQLRCYLLL